MMGDLWAHLPTLHWVLSSFLKYILLIMLLQWPPFSPLYSPFDLHPPILQCLPHLSSCPWVIHISSLKSLVPIPFLPLPFYFMPTNYATYSLYLFPSSLPSPPYRKPSMWHPFLWFCSCSSCLLSFCFHCFSFCQVHLLMVVSLLSFYCSYFWSSLISYISPFNISYNKDLVMTNSLNLTLSGKHFICPSILNDSFAG